MEESDIKKEKTGFFSNWIVRNLIGAVAFFAILVIGASILLNVITHHGQSIEVPDLTNMSVSEAHKEASRHHLRTEVTDSIYVRRMAK